MCGTEIFFIKKYINDEKCVNKKIISVVGQEPGILTWVTNGIRDKQHRIDRDVPPGWEKGRSTAFLDHPTKGTTQWIKNGNVKRSKEFEVPLEKQLEMYEKHAKEEKESEELLKYIIESDKTILDKLD